MSRENVSFVLAERPKAEIVPGQTLQRKVSPAPQADDLRDGQILVEVLYLSLDPAMRGWMSGARSYIPPVEVGAVMRGYTACRVLASRSALAAVGDYVSAQAGWTERAVLSDGQFTPAEQFPGLQQPQEMLSVLGGTGLTAWLGMITIGDPKPGELVVVSAAAGATGSVAGQIAKIKGARVVGICGSDDKCDWLTRDLGFDAALNYKADDFKDRFAAATRDYIDVYFDNVGGEILDMCLAQAKPHARFVMCGGISQYNAKERHGPANIQKVITMRIRMQGFIVFDHQDAWPQARKELSAWLAQGRLKKNETIIKGGLASAEHALLDLFKGVNKGKLIVEVKSSGE
ncbi:hypothetical protein CDD83_8586 [Cordyceps sp. RAO-2017]|nr:hypothetical protein CDD83_8586 [Cordyceps sp. RAO-2017]